MKTGTGWIAAGAVLLALLAGTADAGWLIQLDNRGASGTTQETNWFQKDKIRTETAEFGSIMDFTSRRIFWIDKRKKTVSSMTFEEFRQALREALRQADAAMEQMKKAGISVPGRSAAPRGKVTVAKGATSRPILGYDCDEFTVSVDGRPAEEIWVTPGIDLYAELGKKVWDEFEDLNREFRKMGSAFKAEIDEPAYIAIFEKGYPMKIVDKRADYTREVVRVKKREIEEGIFAEPQGYRKVPYREQFGMPQDPDASKTAAGKGDPTADPSAPKEKQETAQPSEEKTGGGMDAIKEGVSGGIKKLFKW